MSLTNDVYPNGKLNDKKLGLTHDFYSNSKFNDKKKETFVSEKNPYRNRKLKDFWGEEVEKNEEISFNGGFGVEQKKNCKRMITFGFEEVEQGSADVRHSKKGKETNDERY